MTEPGGTAPDATRLRDWFTAHGLELHGNIRLELIAGGRSNLTYRVCDEAGCRYVLRRPPKGNILESAHDVGREHRVISALARTCVPVAPRVVVATDKDGADYPPAADALRPGLRKWWLRCTWLRWTRSGSARWAARRVTAAESCGVCGARG